MPPTHACGHPFPTVLWVTLFVFPAGWLQLEVIESDAADIVRKRLVLRQTEDDSSIDDGAVAEGVLGDD